MKITYDPEVDAVYIQFREAEPARAVDVSEGVTVDLDAEGNLVGIEVLDASERMGQEGLDSLSFELLAPRLRKSA